MTNFAEKIRPRIVFDLTIHQENFYRVDLLNLTFHFDINSYVLHDFILLLFINRPISNVFSNVDFIQYFFV
jgi:hypothetical protein